MNNWTNEYLNIYDKHNAKYLFKLKEHRFQHIYIYIRHSLRSRRQWFETPSRSLWRECNVWLMIVRTDNVYFVKRTTRGLFHWHHWTFWGRVKIAAIFQTTFSNALFWKKRYKFLSRFHWNLSPRVQLIIFEHWFIQWLGTGPATSHYPKQWCSSLLMHKCVTWPQWVNWDSDMEK